MNAAPRFLCDVMLARLARYLRAAGLDTTLADSSAGDAQILREAIGEARWLLTADRKIMDRKAANGHVLQMPFGSLDAQAAALNAIFHLDWLGNAFTRCLVDNAPLLPATSAQLQRVPADARAMEDELSACPACGRVYWRGSHYKRMRGRLASWQAMDGSSRIL